MRHNLSVLIAVLCLLQPIPSEAFGGGGGWMKGNRGGDFPRMKRGKGKNPEIMGAFVPGNANMEAMKQRGFFSTELNPIYPNDFDCPKVTSPFASPFRGDGSRRPFRFFQGLHGGIDIPQPNGTPLLAVADGEIIAKHEGMAGGIGGIGLWVRHTPRDTGMEKYIFIEYKHLKKLPDLNVGDQVKMGQVIAETGNTGTTGRHYGSKGHYHLHMTAYWSNNPDFVFKRVMIPARGQWLDPIAIMRGDPLSSHRIKDLSDKQKNVSIPFKTTDGRIFPTNTKVVWPYACKPK